MAAALSTLAESHLLAIGRSAATRYSSTDSSAAGVMKKHLFLSTALCALAVANPSMAADMAVKARVDKAAPVPVYNWTGCYGGGNVEYSAGRSRGDFECPGLASNLTPPLNTTSFPISSDPAGVIGGVQ